TPRQQLGKAVKLDKLLKQLRRDATASPKKAALLGLMVLVGLYFWAPLVMKFVSRRGSKQEQTEAPGAAIASAALPVNPVHAAPGAAKFQWQKVREQIRKDEHMASATFNPAWADPFGRRRQTPESELAVIQSQAESEEDAANKAAAIMAALEPKDLGVTLGGILIGP